MLQPVQPWFVAAATRMVRRMFRRRLWRTGSIVGVLASALSAGAVVAATPGTWTFTNSMSTARDGHTATLLPDGTVLAAGGNPQSRFGPGVGTAELFDP